MLWFELNHVSKRGPSKNQYNLNETEQDNPWDYLMGYAFVFQIAEHSGFQEMSFEQLESVLQNEWDLSLQNKDGSCPIPCDMENALADLLLKYITHDLDGR